MFMQAAFVKEILSCPAEDQEALDTWAFLPDDPWKGPHEFLCNSYIPFRGRPFFRKPPHGPDRKTSNCGGCMCVMLESISMSSSGIPPATMLRLVLWGAGMRHHLVRQSLHDKTQMAQPVAKVNLLGPQAGTSLLDPSCLPKLEANLKL